jgi:hypothetical protein
MTLLQRYEAITQSGIQRSRNRPSFTMEGITINNGTMERQFTAALRSIGAEVYFLQKLNNDNAATLVNLNTLLGRTVNAPSSFEDLFYMRIMPECVVDPPILCKVLNFNSLLPASTTTMGVATRKKMMYALLQQ